MMMMLLQGPIISKAPLQDPSVSLIEPCTDDEETQQTQRTQQTEDVLASASKVDKPDMQNLGKFG